MRKQNNKRKQICYENRKRLQGNKNVTREQKCYKKTKLPTQSIETVIT